MRKEEEQTEFPKNRLLKTEGIVITKPNRVGVLVDTCCLKIFSKDKLVLLHDLKFKVDLIFNLYPN